MVRQARTTTSPVTGARPELTILTGDDADSQQYDETRWFIDILDGTTGSADPDPEMHAGTADRRIVPDSGIPDQVASACGAFPPAYQDNGLLYDGVRGGGQVGPDAGYYEPDGSTDGDGDTPDRARSMAEAAPYADVTATSWAGGVRRPLRPEPGAPQPGLRRHHPRGA